MKQREVQVSTQLFITFTYLYQHLLLFSTSAPRRTLSRILGPMWVPDQWLNKLNGSSRRMKSYCAVDRPQAVQAPPHVSTCLSLSENATEHAA